MGVGGSMVVPEDDAAVVAAVAAAVSFFAFHAAPSLIMRDDSDEVSFGLVRLAFLEGGQLLPSTSFPLTPMDASSSETISESLRLARRFDPAGCLPLPVVVSSWLSESTTV